MGQIQAHTGMTGTKPIKQIHLRWLTISLGVALLALGISVFVYPEYQEQLTWLSLPLGLLILFVPTKRLQGPIDSSDPIDE